MVKRFLIMVSMAALITAASADIVVNTTDDTVVADDGLTSLREAMTLAADPKTPTAGDGYIHIVFSPELFENAKEIKVTISANEELNIPSGRSVSIDGPGGERSVTIKDGHGQDDYTAINVASGGALRLKDICLSARDNASYKMAVINSCGDLEVTNCRIDGGGCGSQFVFRLNNGVSTFRDCTFAETVMTYEPVIDARNSATGGVVNCTFSGNERWNTAIISAWESACLGCFGCTFENTKVHNSEHRYHLKVSDTARLELASCAFGTGSPMTVGPGGAICRANWSGTLGSAQEIVRDGVKHVVHPVPDDGNLGEFIGYTPDWKSVFTSSRKNGGDRHYVRGENAITIVMVTKDMVGRDIDEGHISPGSYATLTKLEKLDPSAITINSRSDGTHTSVDDRYSNRFELREVLDYLKANPEKIAAAGETRITFDKTYFTSQMSERLLMQQSQIEIDGFTNRKLVIDGGDTHVMFDGAASAGGAVSNRLFYVAPGNHVEFRNLEFINGVANTSGTQVNTRGGGAILNRGDIFVTNCSFRACSAGADSAGYADGGAILTDSGARTVLYGVTVENCTAARGGALAVRDGGTNILAMTTVTGNRALLGAQAGPVAGGAVFCGGDASVTVLINTTVTGNSSDGTGGGISCSGTGAGTTLYLLDSVIVGNRAKGAVDDLVLGNRARARYCVIGRRTPSMDRLFDTDATNVEEGRSAVDVFAEIGDGGLAEPENLKANLVEHTLFLLANDRDHASAVPLRDLRWMNFGYLQGGAVWTLLGVSRALPAKSAQLFTIDQVGGLVEEPMVGATVLEIAPDVPRSDDPLMVSNGNAESFKIAIANAAANPLLADADGIFTITFAEGVNRISFRNIDPVELTVPLRIVGPIEFADANRGVFTLPAKSSLYLENISFSGCSREAFGGAIYGTDSKVVAEGCVFSDCVAEYSSTEGGAWGGAICLENQEGRSALKLTDCEFSDCVAETGGEWNPLGDSIYIDYGGLLLVDCIFDGSGDPDESQVCEAPYVRIDRPMDEETVSHRYHDTAFAAIGDCRYGDTFVVISDSCPDLDVVSNSLPSGVSFLIETGTAPKAGTLLATTLDSVAERAAVDLADKDWLTSSRTATGVEISVVWEKAVPEFAENPLACTTPEDEMVYVQPSNVKPNLFYGLGASASPDGDFSVGEWIRADERGELPSALSAPRSGAVSFYRIFVR